MIYYLITDNCGTVTLSFNEPRDTRIRCYGFDDFKTIPTNYSPNAKGYMNCGCELREIISSYYLNGILPYQGKEEGSIIKPLEYSNEKEMFNKIIECLRNEYEEIKLIIHYHASPCTPYIEQSKYFNEIVDYLMGLYRSNVYFGTVYFSNENYTKNGENAEKVNLFDLNTDLIYQIIQYCINEKIYIGKLETILSYGNINNFDDFMNNVELYNTNVNYDIPEYLFRMLSTHYQTNDKNILNQKINEFINSDDEEKLNTIRSCKNDANYLSKLYQLYDTNYELLVNYANNLFKSIDYSKIYYPDDPEDNIGIIIDQNLAKKFKDDCLLTLQFKKVLANSDYSQIADEDLDKLICYANIIYGDLYCVELFARRAMEVSIE